MSTLTVLKEYLVGDGGYLNSEIFKCTKDTLCIKTPQNASKLCAPSWDYFLDLTLSNKIPYNKPYLSVDEQIEQLKARNMQFVDEVFAKHYLSHLNYYRLTAYWLKVLVEGIHIQAMGFPEDWLKMKIWKEV